MRSLARTTGITALMGVTEPAMYGVNLKLKKPMIAVTIGGGIGGLYAGLFVVKAFVLGLSPGIAGLPMYIGDNTFIHALIALIISVVASFVLTFIIGFHEEVLPPNHVVKPDEYSDSNAVGSPLSGQLVPLSSVSDEAFAMELMGKGGAIIPSEGKVYAPFDGKITVISKSKHAIGLVSESGIEVLVHIGINTVRLRLKMKDMTLSLLSLYRTPTITLKCSPRKRAKLIQENIVFIGTSGSLNLTGTSYSKQPGCELSSPVFFQIGLYA